MKCHICQDKSTAVFSARILGKYSVQYFQCINCGFMQTEKPYWLDEAYKEALSIYDTGMAQRAILWRDALHRIVFKYFDPKSKFVDYGGGAGLLVRLLRDLGLDFYRYDPYANNLFARGFDVSDLKETKDKFELLTAFEVFEHVEKPLDLVEELFKKSDSIIFSTLLLPNDKSILSPEKWEYFVPHTGQHISFYTEKSLSIIASAFNCNYYTDGEDVHILSLRKLDLTPKEIRELLLPKRITRILEFVRDIKRVPVKIPFHTANDYRYIKVAFPTSERVSEQV
jgi:hypothetical protein